MHTDADDKLWHKDLEWINLHQSKGVKRRKRREDSINLSFIFNPEGWKVGDTGQPVCNTKLVMNSP